VNFHHFFLCECVSSKVEEPIPDTLRFRTTKESELDMKKIYYLLFVILTFYTTPEDCKLQLKLSFIQNGVANKNLW
jgi:hypothetical protein